MDNFIPVNQPLLDGNEAAYLHECIDTGWISSEGSFVELFETEVSRYVGRKYGVAVTNGSVALDLAIEALDLEAGDEVIIPTFTIISCAAPLVRRGIVPVCVDCDPHRFTMQSAEIEQAITSRTRAIMAVHIYGLPVDMDLLLKIARKHHLLVIEDAAQAHGLRYNDKRCGSFGDISIFSFYPNKHVTTGEGGMVLIDDPELATRCRSLRNLCFNSEQRFVHDELGFNYRMSNIQAAVGCAQIERLDEFVSKKHAMGAYYTQALQLHQNHFQLPLDNVEYARNGYWVYPLVLTDTMPIDAREAMTFLKKKGIGTRPFFYPMHKQPAFLNRGLFADISLPHSERIAQQGFYIPSGLNLTFEEQDRTIDALMDMLNEYC
jgi:perosamine synthetase